LFSLRQLIVRGRVARRSVFYLQQDAFMSFDKLFCRLVCLVAILGVSLSALPANRAQAATRYFDVNGTAPGSGVTNGATYDWDGGFWNANDATGTTATTGWTEQDFPRFSAGNDANGKTYTVMLNATHTSNGMQASANIAGTVQIQTATGVNLLVGPGSQGYSAGSNSSLKILGNLGEFNSTSRFAWQPSSGSLFLYGDNSALTHGVFVNTSSGLNFNNTLSFGTTSTPLTLVDAALETSLALGGTAPTTFVLANPDTTAALTMSNPVAMRSDANSTVIFAGHDPVTWTNWTMGTGVTGALQVANSTFPNTKTIMNNLGGAGNSNLTVQTPSNANGVLQLTGTSAYGGITTIGQITGTNTTPAAPSATIPALQVDPTTDPNALNSNLIQLNGGVLQTNGTFTRALSSSIGSGSNDVAWGWPTTQTGPGGGGFSAIGSQLTVNINNDSTSELGWGDSSGDVGGKILGPLKFGSTTSNAKTLWNNPIDLNPSATSTLGLTRTVTVTGGAGSDSTEMAGVIRDTSGLGTGFLKNGTGTLILSGTNTYTGTNTVAAGTLQIATIGIAGGNSNIGTNGTIHLGATTVAGTLKYTGTGETTDKVIDLAGTTAGGTIDQSGASGLLKFNSAITATGTGSKTLTLQGSTGGSGEFAGAIADVGGGSISLTKAGSGTWTLSGANSYSGTTAVNSGILILTNASALPTANAMSLGGGTLRNSTGGLVTVGGATSLPTSSTVDGANGVTFSGIFTNTAAGNRTLTNNSSGTVTLSNTVNLSNSAHARVVTFGGTGNTSITGQIVNGSTSTTSGLTKNGSGTLTLTNSNTYGGATTISVGTLLANNSSGSATGTGGTVTVSGGAFLGGTGTVGNAVTNSGTINGTGLTLGATANNGTLSPAGTGTVSTLNFSGNLTDSGASTWAIDLSGATADKMAVTGNIILSGSDILNITGSGTGTSWIIGSYTGTETGTFVANPSGYTVDYGTGTNSVITLKVACATGDFNCDGHVDAGDYVSIRKQYSDITTGAGLTAYNAWKANYGNPPGSGSSLTRGGVPEPSTIVLVLLGAVGMAGRRRRFTN
jgi:autotransporter-associated beta strand protein